MKKITVSFRLLFPKDLGYSIRLNPDDLVGNLIPYLKYTYKQEQYEYSHELPVFINIDNEEELDPSKSFIQNGLISDCQILIKLRIKHKY